ncbi:MAG: flagellar biosynthetic protein FliO [Thiobacillus sp.]|nr:flagellar biosynthetic protein FliO [Thiobacillus sp.]
MKPAASILFALPATAWAADAVGGTMTVLLALALILGGFVALAWLARRYLPGMATPGVVKVVGSTAVGARERVVVVEVDGTWLLLGVGGGQVRLLYSQPKPAGNARDASGPATSNPAPPDANRP